MKKLTLGMSICLLVVSLLTLVAAPALAFEGRGGDEVTVASGEVIEGDLYITGNNVVIDGTVNGDIFGAGSTLTINGVVNGGVTFAGQTLNINGKISHGARLAGNVINVGGSIGRDLVVAGSQVRINGTSVVNNDLVLAAGTARIDGRINGNISGGVGTATITNGVGGNIVLEVERLTIASGATIQGNITYTSENEIDIQSGAAVAGTTTQKIPEVKKAGKEIWPILAGFALVWKILCYIMILIVGIIIIFLARRRITLMANSIQSRPWHTLGWGALILIVTPIAAVIVMCTVVGLPVGLISLALWGIALYLSQIPVALLIGRLIIKQNRELDSSGQMIGALALGMFILFILRLIPFVGWLITLLIVVFGLGTLITSCRKREAMV